MDFYKIIERPGKGGVIDVVPDFSIKRSKDLMVRGKSFYAIWDPEIGMWSTDEYDVQRLIDADLVEYRNKIADERDRPVVVKYTSNFSSNTWKNFRLYMANISDNHHLLDEKLTFQNTEVKKTDYVSRRLPYSLEEGEIKAYEKIMSTLYEPEERQKLEWAIGSILAGDGRDIQKFIVLYGEGGSGKSTFLNIVQKLFAGYYTTFEAKALTGSSNQFATEAFRGNPLVAIQHDGDLSRIEDNTKLNSIVSHEEMTMNEKYKPSYMARANCFLFMATNKPVKITDAKSGIIRRLIDVKPSGKLIPTNQYHNLMNRIDFELGAIATHCLEVYRKLGKNYYSTYRPLSMQFETDVFFNFVESQYYTFLREGTTLKQAWTMYKEYCEDTLINFRMPMYRFREELKNYFESFESVKWKDGAQIRSYYSGLIVEKFKDRDIPLEEPPPGWLVLDQTESPFDDYAMNFDAQYASKKYETPRQKWSSNVPPLSALDTTKLHFVKLPENHIVIDFDIRDEKGNKCPELNLEAATKFPPTYGEFSKSQAGVHLHYFYDGDTKTLSHLYDEGIEIKTFHGDASLRRKLSKCNNLPIATISSGLPQKENPVINFEAVKNEQAIRTLIRNNLRKQYHPATKPSIDFIYTILDEAYNSGIGYDVTDMYQAVLNFALGSTNQSQLCLKIVSDMKFKSEEPSPDTGGYSDDRIVFFDIEVFPNLLLVNWKFAGEESKCIHMINPSAQDIEQLLQFKLIGFNNRRYDNHILYARYLGYDLDRIFDLSSRIIDNKRKALFSEAYSLSYTDVYDFSSKKQSLKKWQIELGLTHLELGHPFDEPLPEELWTAAIEYCDNDVISTEAVFNHCEQDFTARQILADLSGLTVNDSTQNHTAKIIFGSNRRPQDKFNYTDLSEMFPGYKYEGGKSEYRGEEPGEGGYVYSEPGFYRNVALIDVASMHPTSIMALDLFGPYTKNYGALIEARLAIKRKDWKLVKQLYGGLLGKYISSVEDADALAYALKIAINIVYGLTAARFDNPFRDVRNKDNIVAKRGALFMIDLQKAVQEKGKTVAHIKTDSIKIPKATKSIINFVTKFGKDYGYTFELEAMYDRFCLVNDAVYIARKENGEWTATGAEFAHPYIFKTLFSKEKITFDDLCEVKTVTTALHLDMNEGLEEGDHNYVFVGRAGSFVPIKPGCGGGLLLRSSKKKILPVNQEERVIKLITTGDAGEPIYETRYYAAGGTKGYRWLQAEMVRELGKEDDIDYSYYRKLVDNAIAHIEQFVDFDTFVN